MNRDDDHLIDARLRDVPVPADLSGRVVPQALFDDAAIDRLLVRVDLPAGLEDRVRHAMAATRAGAALPLPGARQTSGQVGLPEHGKRRWSSSWLRTRLWPAAIEMLADGGAVAAALSIVALMFFAGTELSRRLAAPAPVSQRVAVRGTPPRRPDSAPAAIQGRSVRPDAGGAAGPEASAPKGTAFVGGTRSSSSKALEVPPAAAGGTTALVADADPPVSPPVSPPAAAPGTVVEVRAAPTAPTLAAGDRGAAATGIRTVFLPRVGRQVPRVPGYDIAFEMAHGESPFVDPSADEALAVDRPPLALRTDSFDTLCETVRRDRGRPTGRRPRRGGGASVRIEDILAALPAASGPDAWSGNGREPGLSIHAVRSLRPATGSLFIEVCAAAPPLLAGGAAAGAAPLDCMLVLDQSAGPLASLSWQWLCHGLDRVIGQMRSVDRISLVVCGERPRLVALRADAAALAALLPELSREPVARSADFDAAFRLIATAGRREGRPDRIVAVAHADSLERCRKEGRDALSAWQAEMAAAEALPPSPTTTFVLIDPQESLPAGGSVPRTTPMAAGRVAADPVAISRALVERVFGRPTLAAAGCRLEVAFDPGRVGSYRIVGHRQTASDALAAVHPQSIDMHAGETMRVVYEVIPRPAGGRQILPDFVSAKLSWTSAVVGADGLAPEQSFRKVLADDAKTMADPRVALPPPHGCELLLAVALGELSTASVHAEPWRQSAAGIVALVSRWQARGDVTPMGGQLIDCLEHLGILPEAASR